MGEREKTTVLGDDDIIFETGESGELALDPPAAAPAAPPVAPAPSAAEDTTVAACLAELERCTDLESAGRLHYQIAALFDDAGDVAGARHHALAAVESVGHQLAYLRLARQLLLRTGALGEALPLLDQEILASSRPARRADLQVLRGRILEEAHGDAPGARSAYASALELSPGHQNALTAAIRCARTDEDWSSLADLCGQAADAFDEPALQAAFLAERARLFDVRFDDPKRAAEIYENALKADPGHPGLAAELDRIYADQEDWPRLAENHRRLAERATDLRERAMRYYLCAFVQRERLGDREAATTSLYQALEAAPDSVLILQDMIEIHRDKDERGVLAELLRKLLDLTDDDASKCALFHSLGQVLEVRAESLEDALLCYKGALSIDPLYLPALQALGTQLSRLEKWQDLIHMHLAEADASVDSMRRASAHVRVAEICETHLGSDVDAAAHYERALALVPGHAVAFKALVRLFGRVGEHRKLIELYERAVDVASNPEHKIAYLFKLGALWEDALEDPVQAAHAYRRVLKERPDDLGALHALQRVSELAGHHRELVDYLLREAELSTDEQQIAGLRHRAAVVLDEVLQDTGAATRLLRDILDSDAAYVPALVSLGRIYHRAGRWDDLLDMYRCELEVTQGERSRAALLTKMGELCESRLGSAELAATCYRDGVAADPSYLPASRALARVLEDEGDFDQLVEHLERELEQIDDSHARALALYRIAEIADARQGDVERAIDACRRSLEEDAGTASPAALLLESLLARTADWKALDRLLSKSDADVDTLVRRAQISRDRLIDRGRSIAHLDAAHSSGGGIATLHPLRELLEDGGDRQGAAQTLVKMSRELRDGPAIASVLRDLDAESRGGDAADIPSRRELLLQLVELAPGDIEALEGLAAEARRAGDRESAIVTHKALAEASGTADQVADAWLRLALWLERADDPRCGEFYARARAADPGLLAAARGLRRAAERAGDAAGQAEALRAEAELRADAAIAAELLVEAARVQRRAGLDLATVADDLIRALDRDPDSVAAAELLATVLASDDRHTSLIDVFTRAAGRAETDAARAGLWLQVGLSYSAEGNHGAAVTALRRGLAADPSSASIQDHLVGIFESQKQWTEATEVLEAAADLEADPVRRCELRLQQASLLGRRLHDPARALSVVEDALSADPEHREALLLAAALRIDLGYLDDARDSVEALFAGANDRVSRAQVLSLRAAICEKEGDGAGEEAALAEAVAMVGTHTSCFPTLHDRSSKSGNWQALAGALDSFVRNNPGSEPLDATLALADVYGAGMGLPGRAVELLRRRGSASPNPGMAAALVRYLREAGDLPGAQAELVRMLRHAPTDADLWRQLASVCHRQGLAAEARAAAQALVALGGLGPAEGPMLAGTGAAPAVAPGSLGPGALGALAGDALIDSPPSRAIACLAEAIGRVYARDLRDLGLSRSQRLTHLPEHPSRRAADRALHVCGPIAEVYASPGARGVATSLADPPVVVVGEDLAGAGEAVQVFLITRALILVSTGLHPLLALSELELSQILTAVRKGTGAELFDSLYRAAPRKRRRQIESAAAELAATSLSPSAWRDGVLAAANAAAALASDDVSAAATALRASAQTPAEGEAAVAGLLRLWMSGAAAAVGARIGVRASRPG